MKYARSATASLALLALVASAHAQNLLRNPGFETVPDGTHGQGILPSEWYADAGSPDTFSNDGSYGLSPSDYGDFPGITAHAGLRWVAGATFPESIGQILTAPLVAGSTYTATAYLQQAVRADLNHSGGYLVRLKDSTGTLRFDAGVLGYTASVAAGWTFESISFVAPVNASLLDRIVFMPVSPAGGLDSYSGLDDVSLSVQAVPEPSALAALGLGAVAMVRRRKRA